MAIGDLIFKMMGKEDPRQALTAAMLGQRAPQALQAGGGSAGVGGAPATSIAGDQQQAPVPPQQPLANAYQSPPDLSALYERLMERQSKNQMIDRGIGLIGAGFAQPENRGNIINAFRGGDQGDPMGGIANIMKLQQARTDLENKAKMRANLPAIAEKYGLDIDTAQYLFDAGTLDSVIAQAERGETTPADVKEYKFYSDQETQAGRQPVPFQEWQTKANRARTKFSLAPQYLVDKDGNVRSYQLSDSGGMSEIKNEDGSPLVKPLEKVDLGTMWAFKNPFTGETMRTEPKDVRGEANANAIGKAEGTAQGEMAAKLPGIETRTDDIIGRIDKVLDDKALSNSVGFTGQVRRRIWGTPEYDVNARISELQGGAFLQAFDSLRGGGAISEVEGTKATQAIANLDMGQSEDAVRATLSELKRILDEGRRNARLIASGQMKPYPVDGAGGVQPPAAPSAPGQQQGTMEAPNAPAAPTSGGPGERAKALIDAGNYKPVIDNAREMIKKKGYDKDAIRQRLIEWGIPANMIGDL